MPYSALTGAISAPLGRECFVSSLGLLGLFGNHSQTFSSCPRATTTTLLGMQNFDSINRRHIGRQGFVVCFRPPGPLPQPSSSILTLF